MIQKERTKPIEIEKLEALFRRLSHDHPSKLEVKHLLAKQMAGYHGEQSLDYYLSFLDEKIHFIFHYIRLFHQSHYFQMDTLIITPRFILIIEAKNISGTLIFEPDFNQLIRILHEKEEVFPCPIQQVNLQEFQFKQWLQYNKIPRIPILSIVVITNPASKIQSKSNIQQKVIRSSKLIDRVQEYHTSFKEEVLTKKMIRKLGRILIKENTQSDRNFFELLKIGQDEILTGVHCPNCFSLPMKRVHGKWVCPECESLSINAHHTALRDYSLLISPTISNLQLRNFLHVDSPSTANKILSRMQLESNGTTINRRYHLK